MSIFMLWLLFFICSLNWQHQLCKNPRPNPDIKTLFVDHTCGPPNGTRAPSPVTNPLMGSIPKVGGFPPLGAHGVSPQYRTLICYFHFHGYYISCDFYLHVCFLLIQPFQPAPAPAPAPLTASLAGWMANPSSMPHQTVSAGPIGLSPSSNAGNYHSGCCCCIE